MLRQSLEWRRLNQIDGMLDNWKPPEAMVKFYPVGFCGQDRHGCPGKALNSPLAGWAECVKWLTFTFCCLVASVDPRLRTVSCNSVRMRAVSILSFFVAVSKFHLRSRDPYPMICDQGGLPRIAGFRRPEGLPPLRVSTRPLFELQHFIHLTCVHV